jgi:hypothetical protein
MLVSWRQLQPTDAGTFVPGTPNDAKYDFSVIDNALDQLGTRGLQLMLRVYAYNSCCDAVYANNTNIAIPTGCAQSPALPPRFRRRPTAG